MSLFLHIFVGAVLISLTLRCGVTKFASFCDLDSIELANVTSKGLDVGVADRKGPFE